MLSQFTDLENKDMSAQDGHCVIFIVLRRLRVAGVCFSVFECERLEQGVGTAIVFLCVAYCVSITAPCVCALGK